MTTTAIGSIDCSNKRHWYRCEEIGVCTAPRKDLQEEIRSKVHIRLQMRGQCICKLPCGERIFQGEAVKEHEESNRHSCRSRLRSHTTN